MHSELVPPSRDTETSLPPSQWLSFDQLPLIAIDENYIKQVNTENLMIVCPILILATVIPMLLSVPGVILIAIVTLVLLLLAALSYWRFSYAKTITYGVFEHELVMQKGLIWQKKIALPYSRLQHVTLSQGPLERHFNQYTLKCFSAGSGHAEISLPGINGASAEPMRQHLLAKAAQRQNKPLTQEPSAQASIEPSTQAPKEPSAQASKAPSAQESKQASSMSSGEQHDS
ncbi:PH domain-containing protein [Shewanella waksmanii]|uniref:PH domain-containing protein n=1 Tax=Shewanella waksmanii TaxID=213783 RepID=UPI003736D98B